MTLLKMGAPLRVFTAEQVAAERKLFSETGYNVSHRAKIIGVKPGTLRFHLSDLVTSSRLEHGRVPPTVAELIQAGNELAKLLPATSSAIEARRNWVLARAAITKRKAKE